MSFECKKCGACCRTFKDLDITKRELKFIAKYIKMDWKKLKKQLKLKNKGKYFSMPLPCRFLVNNKCYIYDVRPWNCIAFPMLALATNPDYLNQDIFCPALNEFIEGVLNENYNVT